MIRTRRVGRGVVAVCTAALVLGACGQPRDPGDGAAPSSSVTSSAAITVMPPAGFASVSLRIWPSGSDLTAGDRTAGDRTAGDRTAGDRTAGREVCVWEAATPAQRTRGLMGVTDLAGRAGMLFVYAEDRRTSFTMRNTLMALSIAFFDAEGFYMDAFDMEPCAAEPCRSYPTPDGFRLALEVPAGDLARWGVGPGARVQRGSECHTPSS